MKTNQAFKDVMRDYDRDRQQALYMKQKRKEDVYLKVPEIKEIDNNIAEMGIQIAKLIINGDRTKIEELKTISENLEKEKTVLLQSAGFPSDYFNTIYKCEKCSDTGFIDNKRCSCLNQRLIEKYYETSNLHNVLEKENFDTFDFRYYSEETIASEALSPREKIKMIYQIGLEFVSNFHSEYTNLLFYGTSGLGKTFLCNCIAKEILDKGYTVLYVTASQLFKTIEDARFNRDEMDEPSEQIHMFYAVDLLVIDDLGTEFSTLVTQSELFNIINSRILEQRPTIISTNLSPRDLEGQYTERLISRLTGNYKLCKFIGEDIRILKKYATY